MSEANMLERQVKICPFCGNPPYKNKAEYFRRKRRVDSFYAVICPECEYHGPPARTPEKAIEFWESRF